MDSWKEIASYLNRTIRTAQRWEQTEGLPVHRHSHEKRDSVYAYCSELDAWRESHRARLEQLQAIEDAGTPVGVARRLLSRSRFLTGVLFGAALAALVAWLVHSRGAGPRILCPVPLTSFPGEEIHAALSPGGSQIAFAWNSESRDNFDIYVKLVGPRSLLRLTNDPERDDNPAWSPDGSSIAFVRGNPSSAVVSSVIIVPAWGGPERKLADVRSWGDRSQLSWSPDGKNLAVTDGDTPTAPRGIFLLSTDSGGKHRLTNPPSDVTADTEPAISPDGRWLAFTRTSGNEFSGLFLLPLAEGYRPAGDPRRLTAAGRLVASPVWEPDSKSLIFVQRERSPALWRFRLNRPGQVEPVLLPAEYVSEVALSRWGHRLVYSRRHTDVDIWRMQTDSAGKRLSDGSLIQSTSGEFGPRYSPAGDRIAFASDRSGNMEIWTCQADGAGCAQVTSFGGAHTGNPSWSPDGNNIAFESWTEDNAQIRVVDSRGGAPRRIAPGPSDDILPSWSRDGRWVYFSSNRGGSFELWKTPADGSGTPVRLTRDGGLAGLESHDGQWIYYFAKGALRKMDQGGLRIVEVSPAIRSLDAYAPAANGVYFVPPTAGKGFSVAFLESGAARPRVVANVEREWRGGLAVSPDGRSLLYCTVVRPASDLMTVENFQ